MFHKLTLSFLFIFFNNCGIGDARSTINVRIVGGNNVTINDFPYQVTLLAFGIPKCGGTIITHQHILTAAHCTDGYIARELQIQLGSTFLNNGTIINVSEVHQNPNFTWSPIDYDVTVLKLSEPIQFTKSVNMISLPSPGDILTEGTKVTVSGWGDLSFGGKNANTLQAVELIILGKEKCTDIYGVEKITNNMICAYAPEGGKDACKGDSGGPLVYNNTIYGVVSWGRGCAKPGYPGVYANVVELRKFIDSALDK